MTVGIVKPTQVGDLNQPSPSIWRDCRMSLLNDLGLGHYVYEDFFGTQEVIVATLTGPTRWGDFQLVGDESTMVLAERLPANTRGGRIDIETDADADDAAIMFSQVMAQYVINSGNKVWFEARVALGATATDQGFAVGMVEEAGMDVEIIVDNELVIGTESMFGFLHHGGDDTGALDAIFNLDNGTGTVVLADVTRAAIYTGASSDNDAEDYPQTANLYTKFGLRFDGQTTVTWFLNGYPIGSVELVSGTHAVGVNMGPFVCLKAGAAAQSMSIDWIRAAYQERS